MSVLVEEQELIILRLLEWSRHLSVSLPARRNFCSWPKTEVGQCSLYMSIACEASQGGRQFGLTSRPTLFEPDPLYLR